MFDFLIGGDGKTYVKLMVSRLRTCVLRPSTPRDSPNCPPLPPPPVAMAPRSGRCAAEDEERRARNLSGVRGGRGGPQPLLSNAPRGRFPAVKSKANER